MGQGVAHPSQLRPTHRPDKFALQSSTRSDRPILGRVCAERHHGESMLGSIRSPRRHARRPLVKTRGVGAPVFSEAGVDHRITVRAAHPRSSRLSSRPYIIRFSSLIKGLYGLGPRSPTTRRRDRSLEDRKPRRYQRRSLACPLKGHIPEVRLSGGAASATDPQTADRATITACAANSLER